MPDQFIILKFLALTLGAVELFYTRSDLQSVRERAGVVGEGLVPLSRIVACVFMQMFFVDFGRLILCLLGNDDDHHHRPGGWLPGRGRTASSVRHGQMINMT